MYGHGIIYSYIHKRACMDGVAVAIAIGVKFDKRK